MNNRGQSIIGAVVGVGIAAMALVVVMSSIQISSRQQSQSNFTFQADQLRRNLQMTMNNLEAWASTVKASENSPPYTLGGADFAVPPGVNAGLNCIVGVGSNCTDGGGGPITDAPIHVVRDSNGKVIFNDLINNGFTLQGSPCNTFNPTAGSGSDQCPWSIKITWSAICGATCTGTNAVPQISVIPSYNPSPGNDTRLQFNPANYSAIFKQGADGVTCWTYFGGVLYDSCAGNVGIGTTSPPMSLTVAGSILSNKNIYVQHSLNPNIIYGVGELGTAKADWPGKTLYGIGWDNATGNIGVRVPDNTTFGFYGQTANANILVTGNATVGGCVVVGGAPVAGTCVSDERLKTDIQSFDLGLDALMGISPKTFKYNGLGGYPKSDKPVIGVVAQDVEKSAPELIARMNVKLNPDEPQTTEIKKVNYSALLYVLINAVKELYHRWSGDSQEIHRELSSVKAENAAIKAYLCSKDPTAPICK